MARPRLYRIWDAMRYRCKGERDPNYGGRGIRVCEEWRQSYPAFQAWAMANGYADNLTIERRDNDGGYSPENCCWATVAEQMRNQRKTQKAPSGELWAEVAERNGITRGAYHQRVAAGWDWERAATTPRPNRAAVSGRRRLSDDDVRAIRASTATSRALAEVYGVDHTTICAARNGKAWKHIEPEARSLAERLTVSQRPDAAVAA